MTALNFTPFPTLATERLVLRQLSLLDDHEIFFLRSDERVLKYLVSPRANRLEDAQAFINKINKGIRNNQWVYWGITLKEDDKLVGTICFWNIVKKENKAEIGYVLHPDWQGRGLMQEAINKVIEYGFEKMKFRLIKAVLNPDNLRSVSLLKKTGFVYDKKEKDALVYSLINPALPD